MLDAETSAEIRRLYYAEHWKIGTIAAVKGVHPDAVRRALSDPGVRGQTRTVRAKITDPFLPFIRETLEKYPRLRATRLYQMLRERGYRGSAVQLRRVVRTIRPSQVEAFTVLTALPGESAQADWADFAPGASVTIGGTAATSVTVVSSTQITATTPAHAAGAVDVVVTNVDAQIATLTSGFTYDAAAVSGDANGDGQVTAADVFYLINNLFAGGPGAIAGDANGDGEITVGDVFYLINYLFAGGPAPI